MTTKLSTLNILKLLNALKVNSGQQIPQIADNSISIDEEDDMIPIENTNSLSRADNTMARCA